MNKKGIITGAMILTIAGVITRILGFVYRIYMSNVIGAEGMGLYQLVMPIYSLGWSIACSGFTTTISKLTAAENAKGEYGNISRVLKQCICITATIAVILNITLFSLSEYLAVQFFDPRIALSLKILSFSFVFMAVGSCIRGYFFGLQETSVPAINQVLEQTVRMIIIYMIADTFMPLGLEYACAATVVGIVAEEFFSMCYVTSAYRKFKSKHAMYKIPKLTHSASLSIIMSMALPLTANRVTGSLLSTLENMLIPQRLQLYGLNAADAMSTYGKITGMAMPLIMFPSAFLVSLSITLVPAVSEASAVKNYKRIQYTISKSLLFSSIIGFCAASLFIVFSKELGLTIYNQDITEMLVPLGIMCPFIYMHLVMSGILNGLGYQVFQFRNSLLSSLITIVSVYFFVPGSGINAFIIGWFASLILVIALEIEKLHENNYLHFNFSDWCLKPAVSAIAAGLVTRLVSIKIFVPALGDTLGLICSILFLSAIYMISIILTGCLGMEDISTLFGSLLPKKAQA